MIKIAVIGTAGRDQKYPMGRHHWDWMLRDARSRIPEGSHLISGGAAWTDHLAVVLFLEGHAKKLTLHLPAPLVNGVFIGPYKSAGSVANYYHGRFSGVLGYSTIAQIVAAAERPDCDGTYEPDAPGYQAMFDRNRKVAANAEAMLAYTFGPGPKPADGGTLYTWDLFDSRFKQHVSLLEIHTKINA